MTSTEVIAVGVAIVTSVGAIASAFYSFRNNSSAVKNDIIETYEKRMSQMEDDIESLKGKLDHVTVLLEKSESERKQALEILQGRNPELDSYMKRTEKMLIEIHGAVMPKGLSHN